ncbi:hypothetical protein L1887_00210 [Cichorium endivia]|nr:hypothetical protein L1887_00210 [Cichorium endivia]
MEKETNCTLEREEEEDSEDEDLFLTSDEESQARFSDEEDEEDEGRFSDEEDEEDDGQSNVQTTVPETVLNLQTREEKSSKEPEVFRESRDTFNSPLIAVVPTEQIGRHATNLKLEETDIFLSQISSTSVNKKVNSLNSKNNSNEPDFSEVDRDNSQSRPNEPNGVTKTQEDGGVRRFLWVHDGKWKGKETEEKGSKWRIFRQNVSFGLSGGVY